MLRNQFKVAPFCAWLTTNGAEICAPTNPYELVRYRAFSIGKTKAVTSIVYTKDNGRLTFTGEARDHYLAFLNGDHIPGMFVSQFDAPATVPGFPPDPVSPVSRAAKARATLLKRDGDECWFCGLAMGEDMTIEHLVPKSKGGGNNLDNYALAHAACNHGAANMPLIRKIELRASMRAKATVA